MVLFNKVEVFRIEEVQVLPLLFLWIKYRSSPLKSFQYVRFTNRVTVVQITRKLRHDSRKVRDQ